VCPERLDCVTIELSSGPIVISWDDRIELLMRMDPGDETAGRLHEHFMAVGATSAVTPDDEEKEYLRSILGGPNPPGLDALRNALAAD
jgi:hypothetical protein